MVVQPELSLAYFGSETFASSALQGTGVALNVLSDVAGPRRGMGGGVVGDIALGALGFGVATEAFTAAFRAPQAVGALVSNALTIGQTGRDLWNWVKGDLNFTLTAYAQGLC